MQTLTELDILDTEVTYSGVCQILKHNPQLCCLKHSDVVRALYKMHATKLWLLRTPVFYQLREIEFKVSCQDSPNLLAVVTTVCPSIERVRVEIGSRSSPCVLASLTCLEKLSELDIQYVSEHGRRRLNSDSSPPKESASFFVDSLVPIMRDQGKNLIKLSLEGVYDVNMDLIQYHCPNLVSLGLYYNSYVQSSFHVPQYLLSSKPFPALRRLMFGSNSDFPVLFDSRFSDDFPSLYLDWLFANENLEELLLSGSPLFTDDLFKRAFVNSCGFPNLRRLELYYCDLSFEIIADFLYHCGQKSLQELSIWNYELEQISPVFRYIVREQLDVQFKAYFHTYRNKKNLLVPYELDDLNYHRPKYGKVFKEHI